MKPKMKKMKIITIGDSWSSAICATPNGELNEHGWPQLLGPSCIAGAVPGSTVIQWVTNFGNRMAMANQIKADVLIMSLLGNDALNLFKGGLPINWKLEQKNLAKIIAVAKKPRTIVMTYTDPLNGSDPKIAALMLQINQTIRAAAATVKGVEVFETSTVLTPDMFLPPDMHPNIKGHVALAAHFKTMLGI
jgi:lysophospholipase L1-like esterase